MADDILQKLAHPQHHPRRDFVADRAAQLWKETEQMETPDVAVQSPQTPAVPPAPPPTPTKPGQPSAYDQALAALKEGLSEDSLKDSALGYGYGAVRGATLMAADRLAGLGTVLGEKAGAAMPRERAAVGDSWWAQNLGGKGGQTAPSQTADAAFQEGRKDWNEDESEAAENAPIANLLGELTGGTVAGAATMGVGRLAPAAPGVSTGWRAAQRMLASPVVGANAANVAAGMAAEPSDNPEEQIKSGLWAGGLGALAGKVGEKVTDKLLGGAGKRQENRMIRDIGKNEAGAGATATEMQRLQQKNAGVVAEVRADPELAAIWRKDAATAIPLVQRKLQTLSAARPQLYESLDGVQKEINLADLYTGMKQAIDEAPVVAKPALRRMREQIDSEWLPQWRHDGMLVSRPNEPAAIKSLGVRDWVSQAQQQASDVLGSINATEHAKIKQDMQKAAVNIWQGHLDEASKKAPDLVDAIRTYDRRASSLMEIEAALKQRSVKEGQAAIGGIEKTRRLGEMLGAGAIGERLMHGQLGHAGMIAAGLAAERLGPKTARALNDRVFAPLEAAIRRGVPRAQVVDFAARQGIPRSVVEAVYRRVEAPSEDIESTPEDNGP